MSSSKRFEDYVSSVKVAKTHPAKEIIIFKFLEETFGIKIEEIALKLEKQLKFKGFRGRADYMHEGVILEVKVNLKKEIKKAEEELTNYLMAVKKERGTEYTGIATDGLEWRAYILQPNGTLKKISEFHVNQGYEAFILWLDAYFFTQRNIKPTAEDLQIKFGLESPTFNQFLEQLKEIYSRVKNKPDIQIKYELWKKHLEIVYGSAPDYEEFLIHTYLVTLVKLIMFLRFHGQRQIRNIEQVINGSYFRSSGIINFIEEDFFTWILDDDIKDEVLKLIRKLLNELEIYDFEEVDEDLFKEIYQDIVGPSARHRIGEYYTPEWLAEMTLLEALKRLGTKTPRILDPACGSGTFLTNAIHWYKTAHKRKKDLLNLILKNVVGVDINPLAVIIAKANYLIALGPELLEKKTEEILVPVYLADSIKIPEVRKGTLMTSNPNTVIYEFKINEKERLFIPEAILEKEELLNQILKRMRELLIAYKNGQLSRKEVLTIFKNYISNELKLKEYEETLKTTLQTILRLIDQGKDSIWLFILRNIYAPIRLMHDKFDLVIGNPPWIAFRYIENKEYQETLKNMIIKDYKLLESKDVHLFTQMEVATLFYMRTTDLYLRENGVIAFVMPRSVLTGAKHHRNFKKFEVPPIKLLYIIDCHLSTKFKVEPLFNVPSCVLIGRKGGKTEYPVDAMALSAKLEGKNLKLNKTEFEVKKYSYSPPETSLERSYYYDLFKAGASIYPRPLWFIDFVIDEKLGINPRKPRVRSSEEAIKDAKGPWKNVKIEGNVEREFIFVTLLSKDLKPFGYEKLRPVVLPLMIRKNKLVLLSYHDLKALGKLGMAEWLKKAQEYWDKYASEKDKKNFPYVELSLNHMKLLVDQKIFGNYFVISATSGSYTACAVIEKEKMLKQHHMIVSPKSLIMEKTTFYYITNNREEAYYLAAIINSNAIDELIKPLQAKGSFGERHIQRLIFEFPIPKYNPKDKRHRRLAELGEICHREVKKINVKSRKKVKEALGKYMEEIDKLVKEILGVEG